MTRFFFRFSLFLIAIWTGNCSYAKASHPTFTITITSSQSSGYVLQSLHKWQAEKSSSIDVLSYRTEKLNRILNDSFIEIEEVKEEDHEDDEVVLFKNATDSNTSIASYLLNTRSPSYNHFSYFSFLRYIFFQVFRI